MVPATQIWQYLSAEDDVTQIMLPSSQKINVEDIVY